MIIYETMVEGNICGQDLEVTPKAGAEVRHQPGEANNYLCGRLETALMKQLDIFYSSHVGILAQSLYGLHIWS